MSKTRNTSLFVILILAMSLLSACSIGSTETVRGSGNVVEETREVSGVLGVELATLGHLIIEVGDEESLRIEAEDNLMEYFKTEVRGKTLRIKHRDRIRLKNKKPVNYYLTVVDLDNIKISSSGDIQAPDLKARQFSITIASSGNLEIGDLVTDSLNVKSTSSGDVTMGALNADALEVSIGSSGNLDIASGQVKTQKITINSSGDYTAEDLKSDEAEVRINSAGKVTLWVKDTLKANLQSSGDLHLRGNPKVDSTMNSSGRVKQISE